MRWLITGVVKGVGSVVRTASEPHEVRAAMRSRSERQPADLEDRLPALRSPRGTARRADRRGGCLR